MDPAAAGVRWQRRGGLAAFAAAGLVLGAVACGNSSKTSSNSTTASRSNIASASHSTQPTGPLSGASAASGQSTAATYAKEGAGHRYLKDADNDLGGRAVNRGFRDSDDAHILDYYGRPASPAVRRAVAHVAERYYRFAAAADGEKACRMGVPTMVKAAPIDEGQFGAPYLRGAKTCADAFTRLFRHYHRQLAVPITVTGVLVNGARAYALLGSTRMPASFLRLEQRHGKWLVASPFGGNIL